MRTAAKRDAIEPDVVDALEKIGATVYRIDEPCDLIVGYRVRNFLIELKSKKGTQTPNQEKFSVGWKGQYRICRSVDEALDLVTQAYES